MPGLHQSDVLRTVKKGQFWALLKPLSLVCITDVDDAGQGCVTTLEVGSTDEMASYIVFSAEHHRYLWYDVEISRARWPFHVEPQPGDAWVNQMDGLIFFTGLCEAGSIRIIADWPVITVLEEGDLTVASYQVSPQQLSRQPITRYERLVQDDEEGVGFT